MPQTHKGGEPQNVGETKVSPHVSAAGWQNLFSGMPQQNWSYIEHESPCRLNSLGQGLWELGEDVVRMELCPSPGEELGQALTRMGILGSWQGWAKHQSRAEGAYTRHVL